MKKFGVLILIQACLATVLASAQPIKVTSWNLGWHVSHTEISNWIACCGHVLRAPFVESRVAEAVLAAQILDRQTGLGLRDETDDLLLG